MYEHNYEMLNCETTSFYFTTFYCEGCLDIQYRKKAINKIVVEVTGSECI